MKLNRILSFFTKAFSENILIKVIAIIATLILFLYVKKNRIAIESIWSKNVPVITEKIGTAPSGMVVNLSIEPKEVRIQGSQAWVQRVDELKTEIIDISNRTHHSSIYIKIDTQNYPIQVTPQSVKVTFTISPQK